jgi:hypothetical protein
MPTAGQRQATAPGPRGSLLLGMARELQRDQLGTLERAMTAYGDVVRLDAGPPGRRVGFHLVTHPDGVQRVLASGAGDYVKDSHFYQEMAATLGDCLLTSDGERWRRQRRTPSRPSGPPSRSSRRRCGCTRRPTPSAGAPRPATASAATGSRRAPSWCSARGRPIAAPTTGRTRSGSTPSGSPRPRRPRGTATPGSPSAAARERASGVSSRSPKPSWPPRSCSPPTSFDPTPRPSR